jgi:hypothetical protein
MSAVCAKMAALLEAFVEEEQLFVICFLISEGVKPIKFHYCLKL